MSNRTNVSAKPGVFLSFSASDEDFAKQVSHALSDAGLLVMGVRELDPKGDYNDSVRRWIKSSAGMVVAISDRSLSSKFGLPANVVFEIGAATGAGKPIFVVTTLSAPKFPFRVPKLAVIPITRVDEVVHALRAA